MSATTTPRASRRRRRVLRTTAAVLVLAAAAVWAGNTSLWGPDPEGGPGVLAHRGLGQTFDVADTDADTCTAEIIHEPEHDYLENTLPSMRAAFDAGADVVELDVHMTADDRFAVFHDWEVDCRTDGTGTTRDHTLAELQRLDIGYGYTADGGRTFPFRGEGVGLMPSLDDVFDAFPDEELLLHVKSEDPAEGVLLADRLAELPAERRAAVTVYGGDAPIDALHARLPDLRVMSKGLMVDCLLRYEAVGWTGHVPDACAGLQLHIPEGYGPWLWGWPDRFTARMAEVDTRVVLVAGSGGASEGFDTPEAVDRVPTGFDGLIWTNTAQDTAAPIRAR
ncbi:glycerophosphodiester phosphodiesterase family protein [Nocardiopsis trehalosi]|uniref:glycerophosphodiester phosphodiesterase family protein n=1 Tax=Nocardiopsis trehalosi TaxID=109329 RepID=UPI0008356A07|nr:glycerophosphodiester phosphodiesterase family protein [Nocardiopsis trehalosi]